MYPRNFYRISGYLFPINFTFHVMSFKNTLDYCILEPWMCCIGSWNFHAAGLILAASLTWSIDPVFPSLYFTGAAQPAHAKSVARTVIPASRVCNFLSISVSSSLPFRGQMESEVHVAICSWGESRANSTQRIKNVITLNLEREECQFLNGPFHLNKPFTFHVCTS